MKSGSIAISLSACPYACPSWMIVAMPFEVRYMKCSWLYLRPIYSIFWYIAEIQNGGQYSSRIAYFDCATNVAIAPTLCFLEPNDVSSTYGKSVISSPVVFSDFSRSPRIQHSVQDGRYRLCELVCALKLDNDNSVLPIYWYWKFAGHLGGRRPCIIRL